MRTLAPDDGPRPVWYLVVGIVYVVAGVHLRTVLLNWIVGPTFPFVTLFVLPRAVSRVRTGLGPVR
jgi:hypothetical protein